MAIEIIMASKIIPFQWNNEIEDKRVHAITLPLCSWCPQGSPLLVVLYAIYANSFSVENLPDIDFVGTMDDIVKR